MYDLGSRVQGLGHRVYRLRWEGRGRRLCKVTPVILHGVVSLGPVILHGVVSPDGGRRTSSSPSSTIRRAGEAVDPFRGAFLEPFTRGAFLEPFARRLASRAEARRPWFRGKEFFWDRD